MSLHPLSTEMLVTEVVLISAASGGALELSGRGSPTLAALCGALALAQALVILGAAVTERASYPPLQVARSLGLGLVATAYLGAVGWAAVAVAGRTGWVLGAVVAVAGLWGGPLGAAVLVGALRDRRAGS